MDILDRYAGRDIYDDGDYKREVPQYKKTNHLLVYPQLGRVKPSTYNLPGGDFTYGYTDPADEEGAGAVVGSWKSHRPAPEALEGRDFVRLNKYAAINGCTTAKNVATYRRANDIRVGQGAISGNSRYPRGQPAPYFPNGDTIFGRPSPACAPISDVLNNSYQRKWIAEQRMIRTAEGQQKRQMKYAQAQHTRASLGHTKVQAPQSTASPFKLKQFQNVPSRVRTEGYRNHIFANTTGGSRAYPPVPYPEDGYSQGPTDGSGFGPAVQF
jgi:hypothetical protein